MNQVLLLTSFFVLFFPFFLSSADLSFTGGRKRRKGGGDGRGRLESIKVIQFILYYLFLRTFYVLIDLSTCCFLSCSCFSVFMGSLCIFLRAREGKEDSRVRSFSFHNVTTYISLGIVLFKSNRNIDIIGLKFPVVYGITRKA